MDDLLREFLTETGEHLDTVDRELVRFEQHAGDQVILGNIFRLVHTIKGTCGFLGLPRLEALAHAAETLMGRLRDGAVPTTETVSVILAAVDRIKLMLSEIDRSNGEPPGTDSDIIAKLERAAMEMGGDPSDRTGLDAPYRRPDVPSADAADALEISEPRTIVPDPIKGSAPPGGDPVASVTAAAATRTGESERPGNAQRAGRAAPTIRIGVDTIEHLMTMVSELVLTRNQLIEIGRRADVSDTYKVPLQRLSHVTAELQDSVMKARMQPIGNAWAKLPRLLRDLAPELGKKIDLVMHGAETELDRQLLEIIRDPLTHMVRNSADHGIEPPAERLAGGKPAQGTIRLNAFHEGGTITIEVGDDGRGLDHAAIARKAVATGLVSDAEIARMPESRVAEFIFRPGFSTNAAVTSTSGRGVGMDVVKTNIDEIGGSIALTSERGRGTIFTIKIPLTLAIVASLIVRIAGQRFALPQAAVLEVIRVREGSAHRLEWIDASPVLRLRDDLLPVLQAARLLGLDDAAPASSAGFVAALQVGSRRFGLMVDSVLETEEIVVKPLSSKLRHIPVFSGNTILGDGEVVLILDPNGIARQIGPDTLHDVAEIMAGEARRPDEAEAMTLLVFRVGNLKAVPLSLVTRLEEIDATTIEQAGGRPCVQYRGRLMPILVMGEGVVRQQGQQTLIVFSELGRLVALAVDEIVDIVQDVVEIAPVTDRPGLLGSAIVRGRATELIDIVALLPRFGEQVSPAEAKGAGPADTVLLVDDKALFRDMLGPVLRAAGYRVRTAAHPDEALRVLAAERIDMIVTDLDMPGRTGLHLIEEVRRHARWANLPVIALASSASHDVLERARNLHVFDVVAKFDRSGLVTALSEAAAQLGEAA